MTQHGVSKLVIFGGKVCISFRIEGALVQGHVGCHQVPIGVGGTSKCAACMLIVHRIHWRVHQQRCGSELESMMAGGRGAASHATCADRQL